MKTGHGVGVVVALAIAVILTGCDEATTSPTAPTASGVLDGLSAPVAASAADARSAPDVRSLKGGGGKPTKPPKDDDGGKGLPPTAMLAGAMDSAGNGFLLTFFNEKDTKLEANTGSKENILVTTDFSAAVCPNDPSYELLGSELDKTGQNIFALGISVDKTTGGTGSVGLHYRDTNADPPLGLITLTVRGQVTITNDHDGNIASFTISGGTVLVQLREGKPKDHVTLACVNQGSVTVIITKS